MNISRFFLLAGIVFSAALFSVSAVHAENPLPEVSGEVKRVKTKSGKITIRHEPIPNLDMPAMSMVFRTKEGLDISQFGKGDKVKFKVIDQDGKLTIVEIAKSTDP